MTIGIGKRRLVISLVVSPPDTITDRYPMAQAASDKELARLNGLRSANEDRARWEANAVLIGAGWYR
jgi:hypothetical protein